MELTAERSLEIITEQIEKSRQAVSKDTGQWLFVSGLTTMLMSVIVASVNLLTRMPIAHLLWFAFPLIIWLVMKYINRNRVPAPVSLVGTLVRKTWYTILVYESPDVYLCAGMHITPTVITLLAVAVSITGLILKKSSLVWFGLLSFIILRCGFFSLILGRLLSPTEFGKLSLIRPCDYIFLFALVGLTLPGWMLIRKK